MHIFFTAMLFLDGIGITLRLFTNIIEDSYVMKTKKINYNIYLLQQQFTKLLYLKKDKHVIVTASLMHHVVHPPVNADSVVILHSLLKLLSKVLQSILNITPLSTTY